MSGDIRVETRHWPLVVVVYEGSPSTEVFSRYLAAMDANFARKEKHGYLLDGREGAMLGAEQRNVQGAWLKARKETLRSYSIGTGLVVRSAAVRFLVSAIYLIQAPVAPTATFSDVESAYAWLAMTFAHHDLSIPPRSAIGL